MEDLFCNTTLYHAIEMKNELNKKKNKNKILGLIYNCCAVVYTKY